MLASDGDLGKVLIFRRRSGGVNPPFHQRSYVQGAPLSPTYILIYTSAIKIVYALSPLIFCLPPWIFKHGDITDYIYTDVQGAPELDELELGKTSRW